MAMPDPTDALLLTINYFSAFGEAREAIREEWDQKGFARGLASSLFGKSGKWTAETFGFQGATANVATLILDGVGIAENSFNKALVAGFKFGRDLTSEQRAAFLQVGLNALSAKGYEFSYRDAFDVEVKQSERDVVMNLGEALKPTIDQALEANRRAAELDEQRRVISNANTEAMGNGPVPPKYGNTGSNRMR
jgi:hypothetical protein